MSNARPLSRLGNSPAFSAYSTVNTSYTSGVTTKVPFATEEFDTNNNFDTSLSRFTPTVAGYYQLNVGVYGYSTSASSRRIMLYKNGSAFKIGTALVSTPPTDTLMTLSTLVYFNGTTDYVEIFISDNGTSPVIYGNGVSNLVYFNGCLVKGA